MMHTRTVLKVALVVVAALIMVLTAYLVIMGLQANAKMSEIDDALSRGPVLVEFGAKWCYWCGREEPVIANLSANFSSVTFLHVDSDENPKLADDFYVEGIPQMSIIVKKGADGSYLYVDPLGKTTTDRYASRLMGYMVYDDLAPLVESAIVARTNG